ncbi:MAG: hypothetical protein M3444_22135 [Acidobacteriota bacterium]|nr:hypothetical protein [Acidobacteriota bacterium]
MRKNPFITLAALLVVVGVVAGARLSAQQQAKPEQKPQAQDCPMMKQHDMASMNERGENGMGFSQEKTTHHFYLTKSGGVIQVEANDEKDTESREQIRQHLAHIALMFAAGNFEIPIFVHDQVPPGVPEMQRLKSSISYKYEETDRGGRVRISSDDAQAVAALHSFLRFQITEHQTGDSLEVRQGPEASATPAAR